jgi:hypothetical protein
MPDCVIVIDVVVGSVVAAEAISSMRRRLYGSWILDCGVDIEINASAQYASLLRQVSWSVLGYTGNFVCSIVR